MAVLSLNLLALASAFVPVPVVQPPVDYYAAADRQAYYGAAPAYYAAAPAYYAAAPATGFLARSDDVVMSTKYDRDVLNAIGFKKDPNSGRTKSLKGYRTGSRAPSIAVKSGTNNQYGYGINNLYGGQKRAQKSKSGREGAAVRGDSRLFYVVLAISAAVVALSAAK
jgi:hypothetical protein